MSGTLWALVGSLATILAACYLYVCLAGRAPGASDRRGSWETIRAANLSGSSLRGGLTPETMEAAIRPLRRLADTEGMLLATPEGSVVSDGVDADHRLLLIDPVNVCLASGRPALLERNQLRCGRAGCRLAAAVVAPLHVDGTVVGALVVLDSEGPTGMVQLSAELAAYVSNQLSLARALRGVVALAPLPADSLDVLTVDVPGRTVFVSRSEVAWVESAGDYVRLHTFDHRSLLARYSLCRLEQAWTPEGFARIHRQYLVYLRAIRELRREGAHLSVVLPDAELPVSRRHSRDLRDRLVRHAGRADWPRTA